MRQGSTVCEPQHAQLGPLIPPRQDCTHNVSAADNSKDSYLNLSVHSNSIMAHHRLFNALANSDVPSDDTDVNRHLKCEILSK